jgi:hypothetical protein
LVLQKAFGGNYVPDIVAALDHNRFREIRGEALLAANLWLSLNLAADRGDRAAVATLGGQIRTLTIATLALVKRLGMEDVSNG